MQEEASIIELVHTYLRSLPTKVYFSRPNSENRNSFDKQENISLAESLANSFGDAFLVLLTFSNKTERFI